MKKRKNEKMKKRKNEKTKKRRRKERTKCILRKYYIFKKETFRKEMNATQKVTGIKEIGRGEDIHDKIIVDCIEQDKIG